MRLTHAAGYGFLGTFKRETELFDVSSTGFGAAVINHKKQAWSLMWKMRWRKLEIKQLLIVA